MSNASLVRLAAAAALALGMVASAATAPTAPAVAAAPQTPLEAELAAVASHLQGAKAADIRTTPIAGIYEFHQGATLLYVTADGRYAFAGDLYRFSDKANLSEERRRELRLKLIEGEPESSMVVFSPPDPKYTITVFTDVDCTYCRALHKQIADYNRLGVKVRYMSYPRSGPDTESWSKAEQVWCATDRRAALTQAKLGEALKDPVCKQNPVAEQYALGRAIGLEGTPGIITERGDLLPGYAPPEDMLKILQQDALPRPAGG